MSEAKQPTKKQGIDPSTGHYYTSRLQHLAHLDIYADPVATRKCGIVCTIGPKTNSPEAIAELRQAGMNILRMNFSHGDHKYHKSVIENLKKSYDIFPGGRRVAIALDTKGPEVRTGIVKKDIDLVRGNKITVTVDESRREDGDADTIFVDYSNLPNVIKVGGTIFIDDGLISLKVISIADDKRSVHCEIQNSATLSSRKGVNLPEVEVDLPAISEKERRDLAFGVENGVHMVFASFIRNAQDVRDYRETLGEKGKRIQIISKIENHEGVRKFGEILELTDGVMVARGDLGIEVPAEKVFLAQKMMMSRCNMAGKPVICATQMLESMTTNPRPTRAEVSDVANAVLDGADCVMLSGETAKGEYPTQSVKMMHSICLEAEAAFLYQNYLDDMRREVAIPASIPETVAQAAVQASLEQQTAAIIVLSTTGLTARLLSKYRPRCPVLVVTRYADTVALSHLYRGVYPIHSQSTKGQIEDWQQDVDTRFKEGIDHGIEHGIFDPSQTCILIQGWKGGVGHTNTFRMVTGSSFLRDFEARYSGAK